MYAKSKRVVWPRQCFICQKKGGGRVCEYMHARAIYNVLTQGRTVQKGGSNPQSPGKLHPWPRPWAKTWRRVWGDGKNFQNDFLGKNVHFNAQNDDLSTLFFYFVCLLQGIF